MNVTKTDETFLYGKNICIYILAFMCMLQMWFKVSCSRGCPWKYLYHTMARKGMENYKISDRNAEPTLNQLVPGVMIIANVANPFLKFPISRPGCVLCCCVLRAFRVCLRVVCISLLLATTEECRPCSRRIIARRRKPKSYGGSYSAVYIFSLLPDVQIATLELSIFL